VKALSLHVLGLLAIGVGALEQAHGKAYAYAALGTQGGVRIERHPAVQELLGSARTAHLSAAALLEAAAGFAPGPGSLAQLFFVCHYRLGRKELIHYQEVQLAVAQLVTETSAMRALLWQSARELTLTQAKASPTRLHCAERVVAVCDQAIGLLGNHALLHGNYVEKAFRDARLTQIYEGTNQINRLAVIEDLQE
jgi:alkylation response protein AidB-like acyl-CoA dehydrogenase